MVGERDITVLLAKLYAEEMIAAKKSIPSVDLPDTIPGLILSYLNELNRGVTEARLDDRTVHRDAKVVAWECLKKTFRPDAAPHDKIVAALGGDDADVHLTYLQDRLRLIQSVQPAQDRLRLVLDPLAEYLAAFHVVTEYGEKEKAWQQFFKEADGKEGAPHTISGFLLAIRDCCISESRDIHIPEFVVPELGKRAGLKSRESTFFDPKTFASSPH
jgi:hypothetical protein